MVAQNKAANSVSSLPQDARRSSVRRIFAAAFLSVVHLYFSVVPAAVISPQSELSPMAHSGARPPELLLTANSSATCAEVEGRELVHPGGGANVTSPFVALSLLIKDPPPAAPASASPPLAAICHFPKFGGNFHFPHFVQFILRCFSYWHSRPHQPPVLELSPPRFHPLCDYANPTRAAHVARRFPFNAGILAGLRRAIDLRVFPSYPGPGDRVHVVPFMENWDTGRAPDFATTSAGAAAALRGVYVTAAADNITDDGGEEGGHRAPLRIALLGRSHSRRLRNLRAAHHALAAAFPMARVVVRYLDNATFPEQVDFFRGQDLVVSPHGAQLTNLLFLPPCAAILEVFPCGYWVPDYFASLARTMGVLHAAWYACDEAPPRGVVPLHVRLANTGNDMCPAVEKVVADVRDLLALRRRCLNQRLSA